MSKLLLFIVVYILPISIFSQGLPQEELPHIRVKVGIKKNEVKLRWAVDQAAAWKKANTTGFTLKRYTMVRDEKTLDIPEEKNFGVFFSCKRKGMGSYCK